MCPSSTVHSVAPGPGVGKHFYRSQQKLNTSWQCQTQRSMQTSSICSFLFFLPHLDRLHSTQNFLSQCSLPLLYYKEVKKKKKNVSEHFYDHFKNSNQMKHYSGLYSHHRKISSDEKLNAVCYLRLFFNIIISSGCDMRNTYLTIPCNEITAKLCG